MSTELQELLDSNRLWAAKAEASRPGFFTGLLQDTWARGQELVVHGGFYGLHDGLLQDLRMTVPNAAALPAALERALAAVHARYGEAAA